MGGGDINGGGLLSHLLWHSCQSGRFDTRDPMFESSYWQFLLTVNCVKNAEIQKKEAGNDPMKNERQTSQPCLGMLRRDD